MHLSETTIASVRVYVVCSVFCNKKILDKRMFSVDFRQFICRLPDEWRLLVLNYKTETLIIQLLQQLTHNINILSIIKIKHTNFIQKFLDAPLSWIYVCRLKGTFQKETFIAFFQYNFFRIFNKGSGRLNKIYFILLWYYISKITQ